MMQAAVAVVAAVAVAAAVAKLVPISLVEYAAGSLRRRFPCSMPEANAATSIAEFQIRSP
jgi:hypothetical protein